MAAVFGPGLAIGEMFGYLGAIFILAAWTTFAGPWGRPKRHRRWYRCSGPPSPRRPWSPTVGHRSTRSPTSPPSCSSCTWPSPRRLPRRGASELADAGRGRRCDRARRPAVRILHPALLTQAAVLAGRRRVPPGPVDHRRGGPNRDGISTGHSLVARRVPDRARDLVSAGVVDAPASSHDPPRAAAAALTRLWAVSLPSSRRSRASRLELVGAVTTPRRRSVGISTAPFRGRDRPWCQIFGGRRRRGRSDLRPHGPQPVVPVAQHGGRRPVVADRSNSGRGPAARPRGGLELSVVRRAVQT